MEAHPANAVELIETKSGCILDTYHDGFLRSSVEVSQHRFSDEEVLWYLKKKGVTPAEQIAQWLDGSLALLPSAKVAYADMGYFLGTVETGERMKKPVHIVQACIMVAVCNTKIGLPVEVENYVLTQTPLFGPWLEQHVDEFYRIVREVS